MRSMVIEEREAGQWFATLSGGAFSVKDVARGAHALEIAQREHVLTTKRNIAIAATKALAAKEMKNG
jgi:hypothetical protein